MIKLLCIVVYNLGISTFAEDQCVHISPNLEFNYFKGGDEV